jgi:hypothetical protein
MTEFACPYLKREKVAFRESLDLSRPAPMHVAVTWNCEHPFHGIRLELGDARADVEKQCGLCSLPRPEAAPAGRECKGR